MKKSNNLKSEKGIAVIVLAVCLATLFAFVALVIDGARVMSAAQESQNYASFAALAALEEYTTKISQEPQNALSSAIQRANRVARMNLVLKEETVADPNQSEGVFIEPGVWYPSRNSDGTNPCAARQMEPPCFISNAGGLEVNAFRLTGQLYNSVVLRFAAAAFNTSKFAAKVNAIAALVPRHGIFLVDLSRSMVHNTHSDLLDQHGNPTGFLQRYAYHTSDPGHQADWNALLASYPVRGSNSGNPKVHYANDYQTVTLINDSENYPYRRDGLHPPSWDFPASSGVYRVDKYRESSGANAYSGPQPLTSMLKALHLAVQRFKDRKVSGDRIGLIFYDRKLEWPRVLNLTENFDYLLDFTDTDSPASQEKRDRHGIFPAVESSTNMPLALAEAMNQFSAPEVAAVPASRFVVLMGDGLTNCRPCSSEWRKIDLFSNGIAVLAIYSATRKLKTIS